VKRYKCARCKELKPESEFHKRVRGRGCTYNCKQCIADYNKEHYQKNKDRYVTSAARNRPMRIEAARRFAYKYLCSHPCVDCGESDPIVLVFDHIDDKNYEVSFMVNHGFSPKRISAEITKCVVRCCNCHTRRHAAARNIWMIRFQDEDR